VKTKHQIPSVGRRFAGLLSRTTPNKKLRALRREIWILRALVLLLGFLGLWAAYQCHRTYAYWSSQEIYMP
jgi:hypothetical protein